VKKKIILIQIYLAISAMLILLPFNGFSQELFNLKVPYKTCGLLLCGCCINDSIRKLNFDVGKEVTSLSDLYAFCTGIKEISNNDSSLGLASVTFFDLNTSEQRIARYMVDSLVSQESQYIISLPSFSLEFGMNTFVITWEIRDANQAIKTKNDTFSVNRHTTIGSGTTHVFIMECQSDTVDMMLTCRPPVLLTTEFDTVTSQVAPNDVEKFVPNNILVRAFTPFPDEADARVLALFHLDDMSLANTAVGGRAGTGTPNVSNAGAFGNALSSGSFTTSLAMPISGDYTIECWINPGPSTQTTDIIKGTSFFFGISDGYLVATIGSATIRTTHVIDKNVWQHIAVARMGGSTNLFINGIPATTPVSTNGSIFGTLVIGDMVQGSLDEVRISAFARTFTLQGKTLLQIPTVDTILWKINDSTSKSPIASLAEEMWQGATKGKVQFQFTSPKPGPMIINFFDTLTTPSIIWSKNGAPVNFIVTRMHANIAKPGIAAVRNHEVKRFDLRGRLLKSTSAGRFLGRKSDVERVFIVKLANGKIERRMEIAR
jgi:hypothetical protein